MTRRLALGSTLLAAGIIAVLAGGTLTYVSAPAYAAMLAPASQGPPPRGIRRSKAARR